MATDYPRVCGHSYVPGQLTLFKVRQSPTVMIEVTELDMDPALYGKLTAYKNRLTGCNWDGKSGWFDIQKVLNHRYYKGKLYYFIKWAGEYSHFLWNMEIESASIPKEAGNGKILRYNARHNL